MVIDWQYSIIIKPGTVHHCCVDFGSGVIKGLNLRSTTINAGAS